MTTLHLLAAPVRMVHRPTEAEVMWFTEANRRSLDEWLAATIGREHYEMTESHLQMETTQGDSRDIGLGGAVIRRRTRKDFESYPVEGEVVEDCYTLRRGAQ